MNGRVGLILTGLTGVVILFSLCIWQVQRLSWKEGVIAQLDARLAKEPMALPALFDPEEQEFSRVIIEGTFPGTEGSHGYVDAPLLVSQRPYGPGYRVIQPFDTREGRRVMVDRGFIPLEEKNARGGARKPTPAPSGTLTLTGALRWPDEGGEGAPFGAGDNVWIARDVPVMAALFDAEPVLIVAETSTSIGAWPLADPIKSANVRNNHLSYALTWGALGLAWAFMTGWLIFRRR